MIGGRCLEFGKNSMNLDCNLGEGDMAHQFIVCFFCVWGGGLCFHVFFIGMDGYPVVPQHYS